MKNNGNIKTATALNVLLNWLVLLDIKALCIKGISAFGINANPAMPKNNIILSPSIVR